MGAAKQARSIVATRVAAAASAALGPCGALLYQTGQIDLIAPSLAGLWVVVALAIGGGIVGVYAAARGAMLLGIGSVLLNAVVASLYGFLAIFFGFGGSR
jgi:hypothetical protein